MLFVDDPRFDRHVPPGPHPECPERLRAARLGVRDATVPLEPVTARAASDEELSRVHTPRYIESLSRLEGQWGRLDPQTYVSPQSVAAARLAAGALVAMTDRLVDGDVANGVALLRPPGHHALPDRAMGYCLVNNVAVAAAHALARGVARVAVVDWDVHHGNGTQEIFWREPRVLYVSLHRWPGYPGTGSVDDSGARDGLGYTVNVPLGPGATDGVYRAAFERIVLPLLAAYSPELVLVSAGFDASRRDPFGGMLLSPSAFGWMARELAGVVGSTARARMALVLEGGYDETAIQEGLRSAVVGMTSDARWEIPCAANDAHVHRAVRAAHRGWPVIR